MTDSLPYRPVRFPAAAILAGATTFALFWLMQALVAVEARLPAPQPRLSIEIVRLKKAPPPPPPPKPRGHVKPRPQPSVPPIGTRDDGTLGELSFPPPVSDSGEEWTGPEAIGDGAQSLTPIVRVDPEYPPRARGVAGWVELEFTVTAAGQVEDARVLSSQPPGVFEDSALRALRRWRYRPRYEQGRPVPTRGQLVRMRFQPDRS